MQKKKKLNINVLTDKIEIIIITFEIVPCPNRLNSATQDGGEQKKQARKHELVLVVVVCRCATEGEGVGVVGGGFGYGERLGYIVARKRSNS